MMCARNVMLALVAAVVTVVNGAITNPPPPAMTPAPAGVSVVSPGACCMPKLCTDDAVISGTSTHLTYLCPETKTIQVTETVFVTVPAPGESEQPVTLTSGHGEVEKTTTTTISSTATVMVTKTVQRVSSSAPVVSRSVETVSTSGIAETPLKTGTSVVRPSAHTSLAVTSIVAPTSSAHPDSSSSVSGSVSSSSTVAVTKPKHTDAPEPTQSTPGVGTTTHLTSKSASTVLPSLNVSTTSLHSTQNYTRHQTRTFWLTPVPVYATSSQILNTTTMGSFTWPTASQIATSSPASSLTSLVGTTISPAPTPSAPASASGRVSTEGSFMSSSLDTTHPSGTLMFSNGPGVPSGSVVPTPSTSSIASETISTTDTLVQVSPHLSVIPVPSEVINSISLPLVIPEATVSFPSTIGDIMLSPSDILPTPSDMENFPKISDETPVTSASALTDGIFISSTPVAEPIGGNGLAARDETETKTDGTIVKVYSTTTVHATSTTTRTTGAESSTSGTATAAYPGAVTEAMGPKEGGASKIRGGFVALFVSLVLTALMY